MNTLDVYRGYAANLFPLRRCIVNDAASKRPLVTDWRNADYSDAELAEYTGHGIGWALGTSDLVIDVDAPTPQRPGKKGLQSLAALEQRLGITFADFTTAVVSPSGGVHYYLTKPSTFKTSKALAEFPDIDFLSAGCYVITAASPHWQGGEYSFSPYSESAAYARTEAPNGLLELIARREIIGGDAVAEITGEQLAKLLAFLDPIDYREHDTWFQVFAACHSATAGGDDGMKSFIDWSTSDPKYQNAGNEIKARWKTLRTGGGITLRTLYGELKRNGQDGYQPLIREFDVEKDFDVIDVEDIPPDTMPRVKYEINEMAMNEKIIAALVDRPNLYQRLGSLTDVIFMEDRQPTIRTLQPSNVRELISGSVQLGIYKRDKATSEYYWSPQRVTDTIAKAVCGRGYWEGLPFLKGVVECPAFLAGGSIIQNPGYDAESCLFYSPSTEFPPTADSPTKGDAAKAFESLADVVVDFPFRSPGHRNVFVAAVLTMVARHAIGGPVPLTFIDGNEKGVGKTLLADAVSLIGAGRSMPKSNYPNNDAEMSKQITAITMAGFQTQLIDNVPNAADFGFPSLDAALTSDTWQGRVLGKSEIIRMPLITQFFATGNGLTVSSDADTVRRILYCQLDYRGENPDTRKTFKHGSEGQFRTWILENRGRLVNAALTILKAYHGSGERIAVKSWGSFNEWSRIVRAPLVWLGADDPFDARDDMNLIADQGKDELSIVLDAIEAVSQGTEDGLTATEIRDRFYAADFTANGATETIVAAREILCPKVNHPPRSLGRLLTKRFRDRSVGGRRLEFDRAGGKRRWVIRAV